MIAWTREHITKPLTRSSGWRTVRKRYIKANPNCECCGRRKFGSMQVHHVVDFSTKPKLELDPGNLMTLCSRCHLVFGHLGDWQSINTYIRLDAINYMARRNNRRRRKKKK